jgi:hypothetical protein
LSIVVEPETEIWQGDLFSDVPWSWVDVVQFVEPRGDPRHGPQIYAPCEPPRPGRGGILAVRGGRGAAMLMTHECVFDKQQAEPLTFARVLPLGNHARQLQEQIRRGQWYATFHIPGDSGLMAESYVDFRLQRLAWDLR